MSALARSSGFTDPVLLAQRNFHAVMNAMARPGTVQPLALDLAAPHPLTDELAAIALTLADHEASVWLDAALAGSEEVVAYLRFHTGARIVAEASEAAFAFVTDIAALPALLDFAQGSDEYPDRSTTIAIAVERLVAGEGLTLAGPGIASTARLSVEPWHPDLVDQLATNRAQFPRGVDLVFAGAGHVAALPRTTRVSEA